MKCIALWSEIEFEHALLLAALFHTNIDPVGAAFLSIESPRYRRRLLEAAAKAVLRGNDQELLKAIFLIDAGLEKQRNDLAHGMYGVSSQLIDGIVWHDPRHRIDRINMLKRTDKEPPSCSTEEFWQPIDRNVFVYDRKCLEGIASEMEAHGERFRQFTRLVEYPEERDAIYLQLCSQPRIQTALQQIQAGREKNSQAQS